MDMATGRDHSLAPVRPKVSYTNCCTSIGASQNSFNPWFAPLISVPIRSSAQARQIRTCPIADESNYIVSVKSHPLKFFHRDDILPPRVGPHPMAQISTAFLTSDSFSFRGIKIHILRPFIVARLSRSCSIGLSTR